MQEKRDMFDSLGWNEEIVILEDPHIPFNPLSERGRNEKSAVERFRDDYVMTSFSQSTQVWKWRVEEEDWKWYANKFKRRADVVDLVNYEVYDVVDFSADIPWKANEVEEEERPQYAHNIMREDVVEREEDAVEEREEVEDEVNMVGEEEEVKKAVEKPKPFSFRESMQGLSPHRLPLKERMKDQTISYVDLLRLDSVSPPRSNEEHAARASRSWAHRRHMYKVRSLELDDVKDMQELLYYND